MFFWQQQRKSGFIIEVFHEFRMLEIRLNQHNRAYTISFPQLFIVIYYYKKLQFVYALEFSSNHHLYWNLYYNNMNSSTTNGICGHISKLTKKNIQSLINKNYGSLCANCKSHIYRFQKPMLSTDVNIPICLHCGACFCSQSSCLSNHDNSHLFYAKMQIKQDQPSLIAQSEKSRDTQSEIFCRECGSIKNVIVKNEKQKENEQYKKLQRFYQFIQKALNANFKHKLFYQIKQDMQIQGQNDAQKPLGFRNFGNTCFFNSVLQSLLCTYNFYTFYSKFLNKEESYYLISPDKSKRRDIEFFYGQYIENQQASSWHVVVDKKNKPKQKKPKPFFLSLPSDTVKDSKLNQQLARMIEDMSNIKNPLVYEPIALLGLLSAFDKKYLAKQEQDAEQLLILLIDLLSQGELIKMLVNKQEKTKIYRKIESLIGRQKISPTHQFFGSYIASQVICTGCKKQNWTLDFTYHYPVSLSQPKNSQKQKLIKKQIEAPIKGINYYTQLFYPSANQESSILSSFFTQQRLTQRDNYYSCEKCSSLSAIKRLYIADSPETLIISLKRFEHNRKYKISKFVEFPQQIDITPYTLVNKEETDKSQRYELYSVIVHKGQTIHSGHYVSFVKKKGQASKVWYQISDQKVKNVPIKQVLKQQAYILFYQRVTSLKN